MVVTTRRPLLLVAIILLLVLAFGGLSLGVPLVVAEVSGAFALEPRASDFLVPIALTVYGLLSLAGAIGLVAGWRRSLPLVVLSQGIVALGLVWIDLAAVAESSLLALACLAGGAAACALADRELTRRS